MVVLAASSSDPLPFPALHLVAVAPCGHFIPRTNPRSSCCCPMDARAVAHPQGSMAWRNHFLLMTALCRADLRRTACLAWMAAVWAPLAALVLLYFVRPKMPVTMRAVDALMLAGLPSGWVPRILVLPCCPQPCLVELSFPPNAPTAASMISIDA